MSKHKKRPTIEMSPHNTFSKAGSSSIDRLLITQPNLPKRCSSGRRLPSKSVMEEFRGTKVEKHV